MKLWPGSQACIDLQVNQFISGALLTAAKVKPRKDLGGESGKGALTGNGVGFDTP